MKATPLISRGQWHPTSEFEMFVFIIQSTPPTQVDLFCFHSNISCRIFWYMTHFSPWTSLRQRPRFTAANHMTFDNSRKVTVPAVLYSIVHNLSCTFRSSHLLRFHLVIRCSHLHSPKATVFAEQRFMCGHQKLKFVITKHLYSDSFWLFISISDSLCTHWVSFVHAPKEIALHLIYENPEPRTNGMDISAVIIQTRKMLM